VPRKVFCLFFVLKNLFKIILITRWKNKIKLTNTNDEEEWTPEEERNLIEGQAKYGNKWIKIASLLPNR
jgi:hypothetical protein